MKNKILFSFILLAGLVVFNLSSDQVFGQTPQNKSVKVAAKQYTCKMHPEVIQDKPGKCPKCGMKLVEKKVKTVGTAKSKPESTVKHKPKEVKNDSTGKKKGQMKM